MNNVVKELNKGLLSQNFTEDIHQSAIVDECKMIASMYARVENAIAVLSDLKNNRSYIYHTALSDELGISPDERLKEIASIWEEHIFSKIHPEDLLKKHALELSFFQFLKEKNINERANYYAALNIRMRNKYSNYIWINHRILYVANTPDGSLWLTLCLYNISCKNELPEAGDSGIIMNTITGEIIIANNHFCNILSVRETEILRHIRDGKISKEIADILSISIHTVNRHRQNILEKLKADNSIEACRIAEIMRLI